MTVKKGGSVLPQLHPEPVPDVNQGKVDADKQMNLINQSGGDIIVPQPPGLQTGSTNNKIAQNAQTLSATVAQADLDNDIHNIDNTSGGGRRRKSKKRVSRRRRRRKSKKRVSKRRRSQKRKVSRRRRSQKRKVSRRNKRGGSIKWACMS